MLEGPMKGKPLSDLALAALNGSLYINIHTEKNANGEIRGQIGGSYSWILNLCDKFTENKNLSYFWFSGVTTSKTLIYDQLRIEIKKVTAQ